VLAPPVSSCGTSELDESSEAGPVVELSPGFQKIVEGLVNALQISMTQNKAQPSVHEPGHDKAISEVSDTETAFSHETAQSLAPLLNELNVLMQATTQQIKGKKSSVPALGRIQDTKRPLGQSAATSSSNDLGQIRSPRELGRNSLLKGSLTAPVRPQAAIASFQAATNKEIQRLNSRSAPRLPRGGEGAQPEVYLTPRIPEDETRTQQSPTPTVPDRGGVGTTSSRTAFTASMSSRIHSTSPGAESMLSASTAGLRSARPSYPIMRKNSPARSTASGAGSEPPSSAPAAFQQMPPAGQPSVEAYFQRSAMSRACGSVGGSSLPRTSNGVASRPVGSAGGFSFRP